MYEILAPCAKCFLLISSAIVESSSKLRRKSSK